MFYFSQFIFMNVILHFYIYSAANRQYGWSRTSGSDPLNYICEIPRSEVSRLVQQTRDFGESFPNPYTTKTQPDK